MKLIDVAVMQMRANRIMLAWEDVPAGVPLDLGTPSLQRVIEECRALRDGLDLYAEANPHTLAPGVVVRKSKPAKRRGHRSARSKRLAKAGSARA